MSTSSFNKLVASFNQPLAELIRPTSLAQYEGQEHLLNHSNGQIYNYIRLGYLPSMILAGPPGVGKTSLAAILADAANYVFVELSATSSTVAELKELSGAIESENKERRCRGSPRLRVVVFIDEIHRFTTVQQDFLLPFIESGSFVFIGATTVAPRKRIRKAILSRCQVFELRPLDSSYIGSVCKRATLLENIRRRVRSNLRFLQYSEKDISEIVSHAKGDMRYAVNLIELISLRMASPELQVTDEKDPIRVDSLILRSAFESLSSMRLGLNHEANLPLLDELRECLSKPYSTSCAKKLQPNQRQFLDSVKSKCSSIDSQDSDLESWIDDSERVWDKIPLSSNQDWEDRFVHSDNSDGEQCDLYSDNEEFNRPVEYSSKLSASKFRVFTAVHKCLVLLQKGESPLLVLTTLLTHICSYSDPAKNELINVMAAIKAFNKSNIPQLRVLSDFIERIAGAACVEKQPLSEVIQRMKNSMNQKSPKFDNEVPDSQFEVICDKTLADALLNPCTNEQSKIHVLEVIPISKVGSDYSYGNGLDRYPLLTVNKSS